jgi:acyl-CoA thioester hydrolase
MNVPSARQIASPPRTDRSFRIEPRWTDLDAVGHVTNSVFLVYAEEARARRLGQLIPRSWPRVVVAHNAIDYHRPILQFDQLEVTTSVTTIGTSSLKTRNIIATVAGEHCASVTTVQVKLSEDRSGPHPWLPEEIRALETLLEAYE